MTTAARMSSFVREGRLRAARALRPILPAPVRLALRRADRAVDPLVIWLYRRRTGDRRPIPPRGIRERNASQYIGDWLWSIEMSTAPLHRILERLGRRIEDFERVLDFGCGGGRVVTSLVGRGPELHACDVHAESVRWVATNHPEIAAVVNPFDPPTSYGDDAFDLLWAWSVLTHIDARRQAAWFHEWARIVRPGGFVLATFSGAAQARAKAESGDMPADLPERLEEAGTVFLESSIDGNFALDFRGTSEAYGDTFNLPETIEEMARAAGFDVVEIVPRAVWRQDCAVLRRR